MFIARTLQYTVISNYQARRKINTDRTRKVLDSDSINPSPVFGAIAYGELV